MHGSKICFKCKNLYPFLAFYKHKAMADGLLNKCKSCTKSDARNYRAANIDYLRSYDRSRERLPSRVKARQNYAKTEAGKVARKKAREAWLSANKIKRSAQILFGNWMRKNKHVKPSDCEVCGKSHIRLSGHHDDYMQPLNVRFLCGICHKKWHNEHGSGLNGQEKTET